VKTKILIIGILKRLRTKGHKTRRTYFKNPHEFIEQDRQQFIAGCSRIDVLDCGVARDGYLEIFPVGIQ